MKNPEKIQKKIDDRVELEVEKIFSRLDQEIAEEVNKDAEEIIKQEIKKRVQNEVLSEIGDKSIAPLVSNPPQSRISQSYSLVKSSFQVCWLGVCRSIMIIFVIVYALIIGLMLTCTYSNASICLTRGYSGAMIYIVAGVLIASLVSVVFSLFAPNPKFVLLFGLILDLPIIILVLFMVAQYIGLVIIALVILARIIQGTRRS